MMITEKEQKAAYRAPGELKEVVMTHARQKLDEKKIEKGAKRDRQVEKVLIFFIKHLIPVIPFLDLFWLIFSISTGEKLSVKGSMYTTLNKINSRRSSYEDQ